MTKLRPADYIQDMNCNIRPFEFYPPQFRFYWKTIFPEKKIAYLAAAKTNQSFKYNVVNCQEGYLKLHKRDSKDPPGGASLGAKPTINPP